MTTTNETSSPKSRSVQVNRILYSGFVLMSFYFLFFTKDLSMAMSNLGIALIFDPFDQKVTWSNRPAYQQIWLIVHLSIVLVLLGIVGWQQFHP